MVAALRWPESDALHNIDVTGPHGEKIFTQLTWLILHFQSQLPGLDSFHKQKMSPSVPVKPWLLTGALRVGAASAIKFKAPSYGAIGAEQRFFKNQLLCLFWLGCRPN